MELNYCFIFRAMEEAAKAIKHHGKKKSDSSLVFPVDKIHPQLKELMQQTNKMDHNVTVYILAVLEYIAADVLHLVGNYVKHSRRGEFSTQDIKAAVCCDKVLCDLFKLGDNLSVTSEEEPVTKNSLSYSEVNI
jgi:son of sevenless-like protein